MNAFLPLGEEDPIDSTHASYHNPSDIVSRAPWLWPLPAGFSPQPGSKAMVVQLWSSQFCRCPKYLCPKVPNLEMTHPLQKEMDLKDQPQPPPAGEAPPSPSPLRTLDVLRQSSRRAPPVKEQRMGRSKRLATA